MVAITDVLDIIPDGVQVRLLVKSLKIPGNRMLHDRSQGLIGVPQVVRIVHFIPWEQGLLWCDDSGVQTEQRIIYFISGSRSDTRGGVFHLIDHPGIFDRIIQHKTAVIFCKLIREIQTADLMVCL